MSKSMEKKNGKRKTAVRRPRLLLLTPPLLQPNTPYPATMHLTGYLEARGCDVHQRDLSVKVVLDVLRTYGGDEADELLELLQGPAPADVKRAASEAIEDKEIKKPLQLPAILSLLKARK